MASQEGHSSVESVNMLLDHLPLLEESSLRKKWQLINSELQYDVHIYGYH
jgi:hypothetical protein